MCRLYTLRVPRDILADLFGVEFPVWDRSMFRPTNLVPAIRMRDGRKEAAIFQWGLIPPYAKDKKEGSSKVNARGETVAEKRSYQSAFRERRCLLVADGFYEYREIGPKKNEAHLIEMADGSPFAFAGIWQTWKPKDRPQLDSCSMITTEPNELIGQFHDRMPVVLPRGVWDRWLSSTEDVGDLLPLLASFPSELMREEIVESPLKTVTTKEKKKSNQRSLFE